MTIALSLALAGAMVPACSITSRSGPQTVSKDVVAADLADIAREAGAELEWVKCPEDLVAEIGQSTRCEIEARPARFSLSPIVDGVQRGGR